MVQENTKIEKSAEVDEEIVAEAHPEDDEELNTYKAVAYQEEAAEIEAALEKDYQNFVNRDFMVRGPKLEIAQKTHNLDDQQALALED